MNGLTAQFAKSSYSKTSSCLEARQLGTVQVRDSADPGGPVQQYAPAAWQEFITRIGAGPAGHQISSV